MLLTIATGCCQIEMSYSDPPPGLGFEPGNNLVLGGSQKQVLLMEVVLISKLFPGCR